MPELEEPSLVTVEGSVSEISSILVDSIDNMAIYNRFGDVLCFPEQIIRSHCHSGTLALGPQTVTLTIKRVITMTNEI